MILAYSLPLHSDHQSNQTIKLTPFQSTYLMKALVPKFLKVHESANPLGLFKP